MNETPRPLIVRATSALGLSSFLAEAREDLAQRGVVVPVAGLDEPAERAQLLPEPAEREDLLGRLVRLQLVAVDDDPEAAEPVVRGSLEPLPVLPLLELPVAGHHDDATAVPALGASRARSRGPSRCPSRASPSSPRSRARPRRDARRARRVGAAGGSARAGSRRGRRAPRTGRARRGPSRRRRHPGRGSRTRPLPRSAPRRADGRRRRAR